MDRLDYAFRSWIFRLRRAAWDFSFGRPPRITIGITRRLGNALLLSMHRAHPTRAVDARGRAVEQIEIAGVVIEWLASGQEAHGDDRSDGRETTGR